ncbi:uncharacterized protein XM38_042360 [Halomicronema hongdechloris C2206]|uniref:Uncharacterized protein n=1 Tax=Halomicronema hongdechloris C2206 TaxID=1641165 RepID=A0A1Z3HSN9_9CYAN|nr:hypothetical protein [Halomicronema hongdechloris]ASC73272.1 uncharacterized protein XM38_042360 [Halomicronema hongdechloris C2206]
MTIELTPKLDLVIWSLLITGDEPMMSKVKPGITPTERKKLIDAGLIRLEKRGRASHIVLEDKAWDWLATRLQSPDFTVEFPSRATTAIPTFQVLLGKVGEFLRSHNISLAEFLNPPPESHKLNNDDLEKVAEVDLTKHIHAAYTKITGGQYSVRVRLSDLRHNLSNFSRAEVDSALRNMELAGHVVLMHLDDPDEIKPEDEAAAVDIDGHKSHILYLKA